MVQVSKQHEAPEEAELPDDAGDEASKKPSGRKKAEAVVEPTEQAIEAPVLEGLTSSGSKDKSQEKPKEKKPKVRGTQLALQAAGRCTLVLKLVLVLVLILV